MTTRRHRPAPAARSTPVRARTFAQPSIARPRLARLAACIAVTGGLAGGAVAQGVAEPGLPGEGGRGAGREADTVEIRARRSIEERFESPGSRVIIGRDDIERMGADTVSDVLRQLPGVQTTGAASGNLEIRMRGMDRNATQILIDGERVGGRRSAQLPFDQLPADLIERVEVIRAPTAEHGGAAGGTINIVLKEAIVQRETNVRLTDQHLYGRDALQAWFSRSGPLNEPPPRPARPARATAGSDGASGMATAGTQAAPGTTRADPAEPTAPGADAGPSAGAPALPAPALPALPGTPYRPWSYFLGTAASERITGSDRHRETATAAGTGSGDEVARNRGREFFLMPRVSGRLSASDQLIVRPMFQVGRSEGALDTTSTGPGATGTRTLSARDDYDSDRYMARLRADWTRRLETSRLELRMSGQTAGEDSRRSRSGGGLDGTTPYVTGLAYSDWRREREWTTAAKLTGAEGSHLWTLGAEWEQRSIGDRTSTLVTGSGFAPAGPVERAFDSRQRRMILWGQDEWTVLGRTTLTGGLRWDALARETDSDGARFEERRAQWQPTLHARTPMADGWQLRANLARSSRVPGLVDVIDRVVPSLGQNSPTRPDVTGNPDLRSETTLSMDVGVEKRLSGDAAGGQAGLNLFVRRIDDVIVRRVTETGGRWLQRPENAGDATVWGLEADLRLPMSRYGLPGWTLSTNASLLQSKMDTGQNVGGRIPGQPHYLLNVNLARPMPRGAGWFGGGSLNVTGAADLGDAAGSSGRERHATVLDVYVGQLIAGLGYWRLGVSNVLHADRQRVRYDTDASGAVRTERAIDSTATAIYLSVGTRF